MHTPQHNYFAHCKFTGRRGTEDNVLLCTRPKGVTFHGLSMHTRNMLRVGINMFKHQRHVQLVIVGLFMECHIVPPSIHI